MEKKPKVLVIAGSLRSGSFNKMVAKLAAKGAEEAGAEITYVELESFDLPLYNADNEAKEGLPEGAKRLKQLMVAQDAFIFASPEYNSSVSGVFKNAIDWASRPEKEDSGSLVAFQGKVAAILSASPGALGGLRGLVHLRAILGNIGVLVIPQQVTIPKVHEAFDESGHLKDEKKLQKVKEFANQLVATTAKQILD